MSDAKTVSAREEKIRAMRAQEARAKTTRRTVLISAGAVVALGLVGGGKVLYDQTRSSQKETVAGGVPQGVANIDAGYTLPGTPAVGAPVVDLWEDFQCPACLQLEKSYGTEIAQLAADGKVKVNVHMLTFLDTNLGNDSSYRAALGAAAAAAQGKFLDYHRTVYANQPKEGVGYTDAQLTQFAKTAGVADMARWSAEFKSAKYAPYVKKTTEVNMAKAGVSGTPSLFVNGKKLDLSTVGTGGLEAAITAAV